ncbi:hypothetical protein BV898_03251 [Hypsibius exemplaris]|uniref:SUEL-type lectin domain-containing protein n=1 Tax=Hypsibius exemplaris TaxID=2072580 RepID=A0A1W0X5F6_HYPEX|nr:hypothetical protein BV898_03251 [Hypsibius exemplaris]
MDKTMLLQLICFFLGTMGFIFKQTTAQEMNSAEESIESAVQFVAIPDNFNGLLSCPSQPWSTDVCMMQIYEATYRELCDSRFEFCHNTCKDSINVTEDVRGQCANLIQNQCLVMGGSSSDRSVCPGKLRHVLVTFSCGCVRRSPVVAPMAFGGSSEGLGFAVSSFAGGVGTSLSLCQYKLFKSP